MLRNTSAAVGIMHAMHGGHPLISIARGEGFSPSRSTSAVRATGGVLRRGILLFGEDWARKGFFFQ